MAEAAALMGQRIVWVDLEVRGRGEPESRGENREGGRRGVPPWGPGGWPLLKRHPASPSPGWGGLDLRVRLLPRPLLNGGWLNFPPSYQAGRSQWGAEGVPGVCML